MMELEDRRSKVEPGDQKSGESCKDQKMDDPHAAKEVKGH